MGKVVYVGDGYWSLFQSEKGDLYTTKMTKEEYEAIRATGSPRPPSQPYGVKWKWLFSWSHGLVDSTSGFLEVGDSVDIGNKVFTRNGPNSYSLADKVN